MSALPIRLPPIVLAAPPDGEDKPVWIQVSKAGVYKGYADGKLTLTGAIFEQMVDNFRNHPSYRAGEDGVGMADVVPFDFHHLSERKSDPRLAVVGAPAQAWAQELEVREGDDGPELWALTRYLEPMRTYAKEGKYKWTSIAAWPEYIDPRSGKNIGWTLSSIAFTNDPVVQGMAAIAAEHTASEVLYSLRRILGLGELSDLSSVMAELLKLRAMSAAGAPAGVDLSGVIGQMRAAFNLPTLSSQADVLAEADKLLGALAAETPVPAPLEEPPAATAEGGIVMESLKRLAARLGVGAEVITAARGASDLEGPVFAEVAKLEEIRRQVFDSLGVGTPGEAAAKLAELMRGKQLLDELQPQFAEFKKAREEAELTARRHDVELAMAQHRLPNTTAMRNTLLWQRESDPVGFARDYPTAPQAMSYLTQALATPAPTQHAQFQTHSPILRQLEAGQHGVGFRQVPVSCEAGPGPSAGGTIELDRFPGRNITEKAMAYVKANGGAELSFDACHEQASRLLTNLRGRAA